MKKIIYLFAIALVVMSCASKRYAKKGLELEKAGMYVEAADMFYKSLKANRDNVDAKIGLKKTGQIALNKKSEKFIEDYKNHDLKNAVYSYENLKGYYNKIKNIGVNLNFNRDWEQYYTEISNEYLNKRYAEAMDLLDQEKFSQSLEIFDEIYKLNSSFKDVKEKIIIAKYEPIYRQACTDMSNEKYRTAYYQFDKVLKGSNNNYKDAAQYKRESREKATIVMSIYPFSFATIKYNMGGFGEKVQAQIETYRNPFISFKNYAEANINLSNKWTRVADIKKARKNGVLAVLTGDITRLDIRQSRLIREKKKGYIKTYKTVIGKDGKKHKKAQYTKTYYYEYSRSKTVELAISYALVSTESGVTLASGVFDKAIKDRVNYITFDGDYKKLVPGYWTSRYLSTNKDQIYDNRSSVRHLRNLYKGRRQLRGDLNLKDVLSLEAAKVIANKVNNYNPER